LHANELWFLNLCSTKIQTDQNIYIPLILTMHWYIEIAISSEFRVTNK